MSDLVKREASSLDGKVTYAKTLALSGLLPKAYQKQPANLLLAMETAEALGIPTMTAISSIHVIDGRASMSAGLMSALVRRAGHRLRVTGDDTRAVAELIRADDPDYTYRCEWTLDRAKAAGLLGKGVWKTYPAAMLKARAISEVCRDAAQECLSGMAYTPEELGAAVVVDADGEMALAANDAAVHVAVEPDDIVDAEIVPDRDWFAEIADADTVETLRGIYRDAQAADVLDLYKADIVAKVDRLKNATPTPPRYEPEDDAGGDPATGAAAVRAAWQEARR